MTSLAGEPVVLVIDLQRLQPGTHLGRAWSLFVAENAKVTSVNFTVPNFVPTPQGNR